MSLKRRDFLKIVAGSAMTFPLLECSSPGYHSSVREGEWLPGDESWVRSVCLACPGGCGILVRVVDGKAVKIEGDPANPVNRGSLCAVGQAGLQFLYDPDRIKSPMRKVGDRDSDRWESIGWEEAFEILVSKLKPLRDSGEMHKLVLLDQENHGMLSELLSRFMNAFGSPNHFGSDQNNTIIQAFSLTQGVGKLMAYDLENSNYVLSFGSGILSSWPSPIQAMKDFAYLRQDRPGRKAKIVQIEPRFSLSASRADSWIPIEPGTEGMLALGIAYVIIKENLYSSDYVEKFTFGFDDWRDPSGRIHQGFRHLVLDRYRSDAVSEITGVPVDVLVNLAKEFAAGTPAVAIMDKNTTNYSNGLYNALAVHSLNALVGSIDVPGGVLVRRRIPLQELPPVSPDAAAQTSLAQPCLDCPEQGRFPLAPAVPSLIPKNILTGNPYSAEVLLLNKANPLYSSPFAEEFQQAFQRIPFIVSFSPVMDDSSLMADLILPDSTYLEKHIYAESAPVSRIAVLGVGKPVIENLYQTKPTEDVILETAQRLGSPVADSFPWKNSQEFLAFKLASLSKARRGTIFTDRFEETQLKLLQDRGWWVPQFDSDAEFNRQLMEKGGWWDPSHDFGVRSFALKTPSRRFEFYSQLFEEKMADIVNQPESDETAAPGITLKTLRIEAQGDVVFLPHFEAPEFEGEKEEYPFHLHIYQPLNLTNEYQVNQPWIQEILGFHLNMTWDSWAEINPDRAKEIGIADDDLIWIESPHGKLKVQAKIFAGAMPDVVSVPFGLGHKSLGRWAEGRGINPLRLSGKQFDELTGLPAKLSTRVKIYKA